jgi:hypothetical protein
MKKETLAKIVLGVLLLALAIQVTFVVAGLTNRHHAITSQAKAVLGITW